MIVVQFAFQKSSQDWLLHLLPVGGAMRYFKAVSSTLAAPKESFVSFRFFLPSIFFVYRFEELVNLKVQFPAAGELICMEPYLVLLPAQWQLSKQIWRVAKRVGS